jgi:hypothetical protein
MRYSSRFFLFAPICVFLALMGVVGVHWWIMADALSARLAAANGHEIAPGVVMRFASKQISGFPFSLDTVFRDVSFEIAKPHGSIVWRSENFAMHALTYGRDQTIFEAAGRQELDWTSIDGSKHVLHFGVASLHASAIMDRVGVTRFDLDLIGFGSFETTAQRLQFHVRRNKDDTLDLAIMCDGVVTTDAPPSSFDLDGQIDRAHVLDPLRAGKMRWYEALESWRRANGKLHVANAKSAPDGNVILDNAHRLSGKLALFGPLY